MTIIKKEAEKKKEAKTKTEKKINKEVEAWGIQSLAYSHSQ